MPKHRTESRYDAIWLRYGSLKVFCHQLEWQKYVQSRVALRQGVVHRRGLQHSTRTCTLHTVTYLDH